MSSTGTTTCRSSSLRVPASTSSIGRPPETKRPISSSGRWVAERPIRCGGPPVSRSSRSSESARCAPRFVPATAWTSSRISVSTPRERLARRRGEHQVERLGRRDQDVGRLLDELAPLLRRRVAGADADAQRSSRARRAARAGCARCRSSAPSAARRRARAGPRPGVAVERGRSRRGTRRASCPSRSAPGSGRRRRPAIAGQPSSWAGVGAAKRRSNQARVAGEKAASGSIDSA